MTPCVKCGATERYQDGACVPCARRRTATRRLLQPERVKAEDRAWKSRNRERRRPYQLKFQYGITPEQYDQMLKNQNGVCKLCSQPPTGKKKYLCVDHDHATNQIRGLLCHNCNVALGYLKDRIDVAERVPAYLRGTL